MLSYGIRKYRIWKSIWCVILLVSLNLLYLILSQEDLEVAVTNVLDLWGLVDPERITEKYKLHVLTHLKRDIARFGPAILYATETFESWNSVFRSCSILSNHHSPSRDIAETLANMERVKHFVSGGRWLDEDGEYVCAGEGVRDCFENDHNIRRRLGLNTEAAENSVPGTVPPLLWCPKLTKFIRDGENRCTSISNKR